MLIGGRVSRASSYKRIHHSTLADGTYSIQLSHHDFGRILIMGVHSQNINSQ